MSYKLEKGNVIIDGINYGDLVIIKISKDLEIVASEQHMKHIFEQENNVFEYREFDGKIDTFYRYELFKNSSGSADIWMPVVRNPNVVGKELSHFFSGYTVMVSEDTYIHSYWTNGSKD